MKGVTKGDRGLQRVKKDYKRLEWVTKVLQEVAGVTRVDRGLQGVSVGYKG